MYHISKEVAEIHIYVCAWKSFYLLFVSQCPNFSWPLPSRTGLPTNLEFRSPCQAERSKNKRGLEKTFKVSGA